MAVVSSCCEIFGLVHKRTKPIFNIKKKRINKNLIYFNYFLNFVIDKLNESIDNVKSL